MREITCINPCDGRAYGDLTSELTLALGRLGLLYKNRWEIAKVLNETKTRRAEQKSRATTVTAKEMQAHYVAVTR